MTDWHCASMTYILNFMTRWHSDNMAYLYQNQAPVMPIWHWGPYIIMQMRIILQIINIFRFIGFYTYKPINFYTYKLLYPYLRKKILPINNKLFIINKINNTLFLRNSLKISYLYINKQCKQ